ncbi:hypothetical protein Rs2_33752 [Raphanus sativus]|nr:hypothetical protein Rs2_33749 [Raphanus sativus]KAJ4883659.1 hypothetical protein Rs2_33752 [Raphanus sativus]
MARHKATSGTLASRESYAFLYKQIKAREDLSSCGFKKQGSVQWICLENKVVDLLRSNDGDNGGGSDSVAIWRLKLATAVSAHHGFAPTNNLIVHAREATLHWQ